MISNDDAGSFGQMLFTGDNCESNPCRKIHGEFESASGKMLCDAVISEGPKNDGNEDAVHSADYESQIRYEYAGIKRSSGDTHGGESEERGRQAKVEDRKAEKE